MESTETPRHERYLVSALVETPESLTHLTETLKAANFTILKSESLGQRKLTFPIAKKHELELISVFFEADPAAVKTIEQTLQKDSTLKRFLLTKWAVDPNIEPRSRVKREKAEVAS